MPGVKPIFDRSEVSQLNRNASLGEVTPDFKKLKIWQIENNFRYAVETINVIVPAAISVTEPGTSITNFKRATDSDMVIEQLSMQMFNVTPFPVIPPTIFYDGSPFPSNQNRNAIYFSLERPDVVREKADKVSCEQVLGDGKQPTVLPESILWKKNDNLKFTLYNFCTVPIRVVIALEGYFTDYQFTYPKYTVENLRANYNAFQILPANISSGAGYPIINNTFNFFCSNFGDNVTLVYRGTAEFDTIIYGIGCNYNLAEYMSIESMSINNTIPLQYTPQVSESFPLPNAIPPIVQGLQEQGFIGNIAGDGRFPHILTSPIVLRGKNDELRITLQNRLNQPYVPVPPIPPNPQSLIDYFSMTAYVLEAYYAPGQIIDKRL